MKHRLLASSVALALALTGTVVAAPAAEAAAKPTVSFVTIKRDVQTRLCGKHTLSHKKAVLTGSTAANAAKVEKAFEAVYRDWVDVAVKHYDGNAEMDGQCPTGHTIFKVTTTGAIYQNRYVSLAHTWTGSWLSASLDGVRTLTFDLKTGKSVKQSTFVANKGNMFSWAACKALIAKAPDTGAGHDGQEDYCPDSEYPRALDGWTVNKDGVTVYGSGDVGLYRAKLPWSKLVKANYTKSKKKVTKKVPGTVKSECGSRKITGTVTVQGNLVSVRSPKWDPSNTYYGVKSAGKKSGSNWRVTVGLPNGGSYSGSPDAVGYVYLKSKSNSKAVKYSTYAFCAD